MITLLQIWAYGFGGTLLFFWGMMTWAILHGERMEKKGQMFGFAAMLSLVWPYSMFSLAKFMKAMEAEDKA